jgi:hypothetical protein
MVAGKDDSKGIIHATLTATKLFLARESRLKLSEADTKANFIDPILAAFSSSMRSAGGCVLVLVLDHRSADKIKVVTYDN